VTARPPEAEGRAAQDPPAPGVRQNPFPGPRPYRAADRARFFGREEEIGRLANHILAHPCVTLFGPSGAGKSSLMQAGVIPWLEEAHAFRVVHVRIWPPGEPPGRWVARALFEDLDLGPPPEEGSPEAIERAMQLAEWRSDRPIVIYFDQLEHLLLPDRDAREVRALLEAVDRLARLPMRGLHIVIVLREEDVGPFRDRAQGRRELLDHGFRLRPLSVDEMVNAVCRAAAAGYPSQTWSEEQVGGLMLEVRAPGQPAPAGAEVQSVFGQIVCRELWEKVAAAGGAGVDLGPVTAEAILSQYLDTTLRGLGELEHAARGLLEERLIDEEGRRTLLTEAEARGALPAGAAAEVLGHLERAAVLRVEERHGIRYMELGHDWLAPWILERRQAQAREEAERKQREEWERKLATARAARRRLKVISLLTAAVAVVMGLLAAWALNERDIARVALEEVRMRFERECVRRPPPHSDLHSTPPLQPSAPDGPLSKPPTLKAVPLQPSSPDRPLSKPPTLKAVPLQPSSPGRPPSKPPTPKAVPLQPSAPDRPPSKPPALKAAPVLPYAPDQPPSNEPR